MTPEKKMDYVVGIVPVAGLPLGFNFPWHDCLMPVHEDYHAVERAINTCAIAGVNTIWLVLHRESQPIIRRKIGEWIYDPEYVWVHNSFFKKREIPIYYVPIKPKDRRRRDSQAWSSLYGAKVSTYVSKKISTWLEPTKFLVVSPYGIVDDDTSMQMRTLLRQDGNFFVSNGEENFKNDSHMPFSFTNNIWQDCNTWCKENYVYDDAGRKWSEVFSSVDLNSFKELKSTWAYNISNWVGYRNFFASEHSKLCERPKYMVSHRWYGLKKLK